MKSSLRLGIELPPVPAAAAGAATATGEAGTRLERWRRIADAGVSAGARSVWLAGGPPGGRERVQGGPWCDPCTLAAGMAGTVRHALVGVVAPLPAGRHPSVLAREVTTLDVLSGGRAALRLCWDAPQTGDGAVACGHLADAVAVCAAMLRGGVPTYAGRYFHISGARNRPAPTQVDGPPVVVSTPVEVAAALVAGGGRRVAAAALARSVAAHADAVVCAADPRAVTAWRAVLQELGVGSPGNAPAPGLLCAVTGGDLGTIAPALLAARLRDAGADGVVLRVPGTAGGLGTAGGPGTAGGLGTPAAPGTVRRSRVDADEGRPAAPDRLVALTAPAALDRLAALAAELYGPWSGEAA